MPQLATFNATIGAPASPVARADRHLARRAEFAIVRGTRDVAPASGGAGDGGRGDAAGPPDPARARLLCHLVRLAVDGIAAMAPEGLDEGVAKALGPTPRGLQHRRQVGMYLAHVAFGVRTADVARGFARDTTTAYHAYRQVEDMRDDPVIDAFLDAVEDLVTGAAALAEGTDGRGA